VKKCMYCLIKALQGKKGQGMVEYALVIGFIALAVFITLGVLGNNLSNFFNSVTGKLSELV